MSEVANPKAYPSLIAVTFGVDNNDTITVRSCEYLADEFRNRTSFFTRPSIHAVFNENFANLVSDAIHRLTPDARVTSMPDFSFLGRGFAVHGVRFLVSVKEGTRQIVLRIKNYVGSIAAIMMPKYAPEATHLDQREITATKVFHDVAMPLVNISSVNASLLHDENNCENMRQALSNVQDRSQEIGLYVHLLRRFVEGQDNMNPNGPTIDLTGDIAEPRYTASEWRKLQAVDANPDTDDALDLSEMADTED